MKKFGSLGRMLSKAEQKKIIGGTGDAHCSFNCSCGPSCAVHATCNSGSSCSGQDNVGGYCGVGYYSCSDLCHGYCHTQQ